MRAGRVHGVAGLLLLLVVLGACGPADVEPQEGEAVAAGASSPDALHARLLVLGRQDPLSLESFFRLIHPAELPGFARFLGWMPFAARGRFDLEDEPLAPEQEAAWERALAAHKKVLAKHGLDKVVESKGEPGGSLSPMRLLGRDLPAFDALAFVQESWAILEAEGVGELSTPAALQKRVFERVPPAGATIEELDDGRAVLYSAEREPLMVFRLEAGRWYVTFERPPQPDATVGPRPDPPKPESDK